MEYKKHESSIDGSVNFVKKIDSKNSIECRFVHREGADYVIFYLSSQTGCRMACRMCHLTSSGQNKSRNCTRDEIFEQVAVLEDYFFEYKKRQSKDMLKVHIDFMARGEPLDNPSINTAAVSYTHLTLPTIYSV